MALRASPSISSNGLLFNMDLSNPRSYKGPPLTNKLTGISATAGTGTGYVLTASSESDVIPGVSGAVPVTVCNLQNTGASWCCVNFMNFGNTGATISGSTLYTYLLLYRVDSGYTHPNFMYRYMYGNSGYLGEAGVFDTNKRTYLGDGWYYAWNTFTTEPGTTNMTCYSFSYNYSSYTDKYSWAKVAIVQGDYSGLHPNYWPALNTTVANTAVLYDVLGNSSITATSLTYASDGTISFNGTSDYCTGSDLGQLTTFTVEAWFKPTSYPNNSACVVSSAYPGNNSTVNFKIGYEGGSSMYGGYYNGGWYYSPGVATSLNTWQQVVCTYDGSSLAIYSNGASGGSNSSSTVPNSSGAGFRIGRRWDIGDYFAGNIGVVRIYNRALSAAEVLQNFNALRGRYGI